MGQTNNWNVTSSWIDSQTLITPQSCKSGRAFLVGFGPKVDEISGLIRARDVLFVSGAQKYNQSNLATLLNFFRPNLTFVVVFSGMI